MSKSSQNAPKSRAAELSFVVIPETSGLTANQPFPSRSAIARQLQPNTSVVIASGAVGAARFRLSRGAGKTVSVTPVYYDADGNEIAKVRKQAVRTVYRVESPETSGLEQGALFNSIRGIVAAMAINSQVKVVDIATNKSATINRAVKTFRVV